MDDFIELPTILQGDTQVIMRIIRTGAIQQIADAEEGTIVFIDPDVGLKTTASYDALKKALMVRSVG